MIFKVTGVPKADRQGRVKELAQLGFTWANLGEEQYWVDQAVTIPQHVQERLFTATEKLWDIFDKAARFVLGKRDLYHMLSIPEVLWDGLDWLEPNPPGQISRYARFDFCLTESGGIKLLELNADTPTGYVEAAVATPWMCEQYHLQTPNARMEQQLRKAWSKEKPEYAACIAYGEHEEDSGTIRMLAKHSGLENIKCIDCLDLWVDNGILKAGDGERIRSLFALYPKEWMGVDDGGEALAYALEMGHVTLHNSLHAVILQSKGLQAVIWGLHELKSDFFNAEEHEWIEEFMLPTYNKPVFRGNYVSKSMFGREGGSVRMFDHSGNMDLADQEGFDTSVLFHNVYQQRVDLPQVELHNGMFHFLTGVFVIDGEPCGLLGRAGGLITGNSSHFAAIGVRTS